MEVLLGWVTTPSWRSLAPNGTTVLPSLMVPLAECEETQMAVSVAPSAASMAGASTGQRVKDAQLPLRLVAAVADPMDATAPRAVSPASSPMRVRFEVALMSSPLTAAAVRAAACADLLGKRPGTGAENGRCVRRGKRLRRRREWRR